VYRSTLKTVERLLLQYAELLSFLLPLTDQAFSPVPISKIFWNLRILKTVGRTPWSGDQPDARPLLIQTTKTDTYPCFEWDSSPRSHCSNGLDRTDTVIDSCRSMEQKQRCSGSSWNPTRDRCSDAFLECPRMLSIKTGNQSQRTRSDLPWAEVRGRLFPCSGSFQRSPCNCFNSANISFPCLSNKGK
jgi:hypothetical protein